MQTPTDQAAAAPQRLNADEYERARIDRRVNDFTRMSHLGSGHDMDQGCLIASLRRGGWSTGAIGLILRLRGDEVEDIERAARGAA